MYLAHGPAAHIRLTVVGLTFALMLAGCDDPPVGPNQRESAQRPASRSRVTILTLDDAFRAIAEEVPAFAGLYVDHAGSLVVLSTDEASGEQIKTAIRRSILADVEKGRFGGVRPIRLTRVKHGFSDLHRYKGLLKTKHWGTGVIMIDIDEVANKLRIVVPDLDAANAVAQGFGAEGIPSDAFVVQLGSPGLPELDVADKFRPIPGGVQIADSARQQLCSNGVNVETTDLGVGFITASHCTYRFGNAQDGTPFYQNTLTSGNRVGLEAADGDTFSCVQGGTTYQCRYSDAAFIAYDSAQHSDHGTLARTLGPGGPFAKVINSSSPRFLLNTPPFQPPISGDSVHKVGKTTGWTKGVIVATCVDELWPLVSQGSLTNFYLLCQYVADYESSGGDSGAPVFSWSGSGSYVDLVGIHAGKYSADTTQRIFSRWLYVDFELNAYAGGITVEY